MNLIIRLLINAAALYAASYFVEGVALEGDWTGILIVALIFGVINAILKPILKIVSFPFILMSFGLLALVINALMLLLTANLSQALVVDGFMPALFGSIVISIVSWLLGTFLDDK